jgi:very-short-patch-repair endonuclease
MPNRELFESRLTAFKERLLDLSGRNRMIHSNFQARSRLHFRFIDEVPNQLYEKLTSSKMDFEALPEPEETPKDEESSEFKSALEIAMLSDPEYLASTQGIETNESDNLNQDAEAALRVLKNKVRNNLGMTQIQEEGFSIDAHARAHGFNPSYELPFSTDEGVMDASHHTDNKIQTLMLPETLRRYMSTTYARYKSSIRESGVNPLFICFGFLEWRESPTSDKKLYSPLLMLQVELDDEKKSSKLSVSSTGDEISINYTLNEKLKRDFGITLPEITQNEEDEEDDSVFNVEEYLKKVEEEIALPNNWKVRNWASFGIYQAQNMPIYLDIEKLLVSNFSELLEKLVTSDFENQQDSSSGELYDVDKQEISLEVPALINPADASQFSAIVDVLRGKNLVIKGPPGTGKSQTITNMIAALMLQGKSVLFVAQKQAALDVVRNNLAAAGLEDYLLEIFSIKGKKKTVMDSFAKRINQEPPKEPNDYYKKLEALHETKAQLNQHAEILATEYGSSGLTVHDIIWDTPDIDYEISSDLTDIFKNVKPNLVSETILNNDTNNLSFLKNTYADIFGDKVLKNLAVSKIKKHISNPIEVKEIQKELTSISELVYPNFLEFDNVIAENRQLDYCLADESYKSGLLNQFYIDGGEDSAIWSVTRLLLQDSKDIVYEYLKDKDKLESSIKQFNDDKEFIETSFDNENDLYSDANIKEAIIALKGSHLFSFFFSDWRKAHRLFKDLYKKTTKHSGKEEAELLNRYLTFVKNGPKQQSKIDDLKTKLDKLKTKISSFSKDFDFKLFDEFDKDKCDWILKENTYHEDFNKAWLEKPNTVYKYIKLLNESSGYEEQLKAFMDKLEVWNPNCIYKNLDLVTSLADSAISLEEYMNWLNIEDKIEKKEVLLFYKEYSKGDLDIKNIETAYKHIIRKKQQKDIYEQHPGLGLLSSTFINKLRNDLAFYDEQILELSKELVASGAYAKGDTAPSGQSRGRVGEKTEMGLLNHVAAVPNNRTTIREMFGRAMDAAISVKPCTLMSPLAVSQTLNLAEIYDVVIIDEASQMKPEFSIPAIARAKQAVIVGDEKQLPPTTVFQSRNSEDINDEDLSDESILDMANAVLHPARELLYHYRSRHEDLIRFSNAEFYENLMIPVTAHTNQPNRGIKHIFLEDARYVPGTSAGPGGINPLEAKRVVAEVLKIMEERPHESIGVATMNQKQKELIESEFQLQKSRNIHALKYESYWQEKDEGLHEFFIKNLENVQGDERDTIVISTLYGPHAQDGSRDMYQRFGDINKAAGWRRLNVLFTRAKNQIILVTSMVPGDIQDEGKSRGIGVLKRYIAFAESKILQEGVANSREIESPFQQWAIEQINALDGFSCDWEIGAQGYRIDIGVKHEDYPYGYILAVETDGASYHSTKSARDRDFLRQKILEGYGWHFHRIWSTDWIANPLWVRDKLHTAMKIRLNQCLENLEKIKEKNAEIGNDTDNIDVEASPEDMNIYTGVQAYEYPETNVADYMSINKNAFNNQSYKSELRKGIQGIIELESPISFNLLVERIRKAHGFHRAGQEIRHTVNMATKNINRTIHNDEAYFWDDEMNPETYSDCRYPSKGFRDISNVAPEEVKAIAKYLSKDNSINIVDMPKEISSFLGYSKINSQTREQIEAKLN